MRPASRGSGIRNGRFLSKRSSGLFSQRHRRWCSCSWSEAPPGPEHVKETLVGAIFTVAPGHILRAALSTVVGLLHFLLRRPFFEITNDPGRASSGGGGSSVGFRLLRDVRLVVTSSVKIAGVLLVFGLLVIPAVLAVMATSATGLEHSRSVGSSGSSLVLGLIGSVQLDFPAAPSILVALTICPSSCSASAWGSVEERVDLCDHGIPFSEDSVEYRTGASSVPSSTPRDDAGTLLLEASSVTPPRCGQGRRS